MKPFPFQAAIEATLILSLSSAVSAATPGITPRQATTSVREILESLTPDEALAMFAEATGVRC